MKRPGVSPITIIWGLLLFLALALGGAAIWMVQRRHNKTTSSDTSLPAGESLIGRTRVEILDNCVFGSPDCELVWIPDGANEEVGSSEVSGDHPLALDTELQAPSTVPAAQRLQQALPLLEAPSPIVVPRDASLLVPARPLPDSNERTLTSEAYRAITARSMNPPQSVEEVTDPLVRAELASRLVIIIGMGVHSGYAQTRAKIQLKGVHGALPLFEVHIPTFLPVAQPNFVYRFYLAFDHNDEMYEKQSFRDHIEAEFSRMLAEEDAKRWHPSGYVPGVTVDGSTLVATLHWVHCNYAGKPSWAHSDAVSAGFKEGGDYAFRMNDDTSFPPQADWAERFIEKLRTAKPVPNFGSVGPHCESGPQGVLTHDFTHRTHVVIFGYHYPRSLPNWSSDDWVSYVYKQYGHMHRMRDVTVVHHLHGQRYNADDRGPRLVTLNAEIEAGARTIDEWTKRTHEGLVMPHQAEVVTCC